MSDPTLYLYTSLTAGSSHIITATSRIETILKANKIPFKAIDCATDDKARLIWGRRSKGRKIPGLVKYGSVIGDLEQIEEWNEFGELKDQIKNVMDLFGEPAEPSTISEASAAAEAEASAARKRSSQPTSRSASETRHISISDPRDAPKETNSTNPAAALKKDDTPLAMAMRQAGAEAAAKAGQKKTSSISAAKAATSKTDATDPKTLAPVSSDSTLDTQSQEPSPTNTGAKAPSLLAAEGSRIASIDKIGEAEAASETSSGSISPTTESDSGATKSNEEQMLEVRRKSSVPPTKSSLSKTTSVTEIDNESPAEAKKTEKESAIVEEAEGAGTETGAGTQDKTATKIGATDEAEQKVLKGTKPQEAETTDIEAVGVSVGD